MAIKELLNESNLLISISTSTIQGNEGNDGEKQAENFVILSMWVVFERCLVEYLQQIVNVPAISSIREEVLKRVVQDVEWWKVDDKLDLVKQLLTPNFVGRLKQIKQYRNWVAHRSSEAAPSKTSPQFAFDNLKEAIILLTLS
jgi:hypothetical protein